MARRIHGICCETSQKRSASRALERLPSVRRAFTKILRRLDNMYPDVKPPLYHRTPWELLVATILSAQSTDKLVNSVTPVCSRNIDDS